MGFNHFLKVITDIIGKTIIKQENISELSQYDLSAHPKGVCLVKVILGNESLIEIKTPLHFVISKSVNKKHLCFCWGDVHN